MKKTQREIYRILTNEVDFTLCSFCKYDGYYGGACYGEVELECHHPLNNKSLEFDDQVDNASQCGDCWGFRPSHPIAFIADIIGIIISKGWDSASWWQDKKGIWKVAGIAP